MQEYVLPSKHHIHDDAYSPRSYWTNEFRLFYNATDGIDIDGAWIDMNEPSNVCLLYTRSPPFINVNL